MAATQPPPTNLKDRIAALQQRSSSPPSPSPSPATPPRDASLTPPRGSLRDKIAKFERKGGVPIPRGSFAMGAPPPEDAGSTKSRELYGNRVAALGKGRPTAPGNPGHRVVTSPAAPLASPSSRTSPDENAAKSAAHLTPNSIGQSVSSSISLSCRSSSGLTDRPVSLLDVADGSDEAPGTSVQLSASPQLEPSTGPQSATSKPTVSAGHYSLPVSSSSSTSLVVTTVPRGDVSSPPRATSSEGTATPVGSTPTLITYEESPAHAELCTQDYPPIATPKSAVSTVQVHIPSEQVPAKEATISANLWGFRLDRPPQNGTPAILSLHSDTSSVTQPPSSSLTSSADILKEESTSSTSDAPILNQIKSGLPPHSSPTSASTITFPSTISSTVPSVSEDFDDSITMSSPPVAEPGRRSFSAVVHRGGDGDGDNRSNSSHSTISNSSTIIPRPSSSSSFKTGTDGGVVRSKRNFKHLGAVAADPPPSPGAGDLAALLQEAAWLEQQLSNENTTLTVPYALGEDGQKAEKSAPLPAAATKAGQAIVPAPMVATSTRTKGRGLTLGSSISASPSNTLQSPVQSSPSTPSFQIHADALPTPPKSTRGRKYFSLRGAFRGPRLSVSSEMSSDDSAAIATPPSPSFDLAMQQTVQGHSNDSMSIRSMFSIRSNKSGKSDSAPGSLRLSPRHSVARASSFAERLLNRASKTKPMLDDPGDVIPERLPMLPPIIPETPGSLLSITPTSASTKNESPLSHDIFDAFPNVPSEIPQRPASASYLFPVPPRTAPVEQDFRRSTIGISTS